MNALIVDDLVSTAGSLVEAARALKDAGAKEVYAAITHPVLSGPAIQRLSASPIKELVVTDSIPISVEKRIHKIKVLSVAPLFGEAIRRIHGEESINVLFHEQWEDTVKKEELVSEKRPKPKSRVKSRS